MLRLASSDTDFDARFTELVNDRRESDSDVSSQVSAILSDVKTRGDEALVTAGYRR